MPWERCCGETPTPEPIICTALCAACGPTRSGKPTGLYLSAGTITDAKGTRPFTTWSTNQWQVSNLKTQNVVGTALNVGGSAQCAPTFTNVGDTPYAYIMTCETSSPYDKASIQRLWAGIDCTGGKCQYWPYIVPSPPFGDPGGNSSTSNITISCDGSSNTLSLSAALSSVVIAGCPAGFQSGDPVGGGVSVSFDICPQILITLTDCCTPHGILVGTQVAIYYHGTSTLVASGITNASGFVLRPVYGDNSYDITFVGTTLVDGVEYVCSTGMLTDVSVGRAGLVSVTGCLYCYDNDPLACIQVTAQGCNDVYAGAWAFSLSGPESHSYTTTEGFIRTCISTTGTYEYSLQLLPRFVTATGSIEIDTLCGAGSVHNLTVMLAVASGYYCYSATVAGTHCLYPLPDMLYCTFSIAGVRALTYAAGAWTATFTYLTVDYIINFEPNGAMTATADGVSFTCTATITKCPVTGPFYGTINTGTESTTIGNGILTE